MYIAFQQIWKSCISPHLVPIFLSVWAFYFILLMPIIINSWLRFCLQIKMQHCDDSCCSNGANKLAFVKPLQTLWHTTQVFTEGSALFKSLPWKCVGALNCNAIICTNDNTWHQYSLSCWVETPKAVESTVSGTMTHAGSQQRWIKIGWVMDSKPEWREMLSNHAWHERVAPIQNGSESAVLPA